MKDLQPLAIPTEFLPENWRTEVAEKFEIKPDTVTRIANGTRNNKQVFDYLLDLAEKGKKIEADRILRLQNLSAPITHE